MGDYSILPNQGSPLETTIYYPTGYWKFVFWSPVFNKSTITCMNSNDRAEIDQMVDGEQTGYMVHLTGQYIMLLH